MRGATEYMCFGRRFEPGLCAMYKSKWEGFGMSTVTGRKRGSGGRYLFLVCYSVVMDTEEDWKDESSQYSKLGHVSESILLS